MRLNIGINRYADGDDLTVCENDARAMAKLFGGATLLSRAATHQAMIDGMWLAAQSPAPGQWGVIVYSGHGSYRRDTSGDEPDRRDECLVPHGFFAIFHQTDDRLAVRF